jgi:prepilin-type N-terminal cleavage/methylation domain-containing protein
MKPIPEVRPSWPAFLDASVRGFTLTEIMVVTAIFSLLIVAVASLQIMGLRMYRISETKLTSTAEGRKALNRVRDEIRMGKIVEIGNGTATSFTRIPDNTPQIGNALQICMTTNRNSFVRYFLDTNTTSLNRVVNGEVHTVANYITNELAFCAEDYTGNVLTNNQNNRVIRMTLEFYQWEFPMASAGRGGMYDYYRLQTRATRRTIE